VVNAAPGFSYLPLLERPVTLWQRFDVEIELKRSGLLNAKQEPDVN